MGRDPSFFPRRGMLLQPAPRILRYADSPGREGSLQVGKRFVLLGCILLAMFFAGCRGSENAPVRSAGTSLTPSVRETTVPAKARLRESEDSRRCVRAVAEGGRAAVYLDAAFWREYLGVEITQVRYEVDGMNGACAGVYVDTPGRSAAPVVLFLMDNGTVEYLDVERALSAGPAGKLASMGALPGLFGIVDLIPGFTGDPQSDDGAYAADNKTVYAVDGAGRSYDVSPAVAAANGAGP